MEKLLLKLQETVTSQIQLSRASIEMGFNRNFKMGLGDIDVIEESLRLRLSSLSLKDVAVGESKNTINSEIQKIQNVLGHLHNQKNWYRPKDKVYVSG